MDGTTLEQAIQEESARRIAALRADETAEMQRFEADYDSQLARFQKETQTAMQARLEQELAKVQNRAALERKKIRLLGLERFIAQGVEDVVLEIRRHPLYKPYVLDAVCEVLTQLDGEAEIHLTGEDLLWKDEILEAVRERIGERRLTFVEDPQIRWGGCLVEDKRARRFFNGTLERIYFRKATLIRREMTKRLADFESGRKAPPTTTKE